MKKFKRGLALAMAATMCIAPVAVQAKNKNADSHAPVEGHTYEITWTSYQVMDVPEDAKYLQEINEKYNVKIIPVNIDNSKYDELLNLRIAAGEIPDHFFVRSAAMLPTYVKQGVLAEFPQEIIREYAPDWVEILEEQTPGVLDFGKVDGKQYGVPLMNPGNIFHVPLVYNKTWMDAVGVTETPTTLDEFEDLMYKFALEDPDGNGVKDTYGLSEQGMLAVFGAYGLVSNGGRFASPNLGYWSIDDDGNVYNDATAPVMKEVLEKLAKWYKDGIIDPEFITGENSSSHWANSDAFLRGRIGFSCLGNYYHWLERDQFFMEQADGTKVGNQPGGNALEIENLGIDAKLTFGEALEGPYGDKGIKAFSMLSGFISYGVDALKDPGKIAMMLKIQSEITTEPDIEKRTEYNRGEKGIYWDWLDEKTKIDTIALPPHDTNFGEHFKQGAGFITRDLYSPSRESGRDKWAYEHGFDQGSIFTAIQVGMPSEGKYKPELIKIRDTAYIAIITGQKPISHFDDFVKEYSKAGGAVLEKEANEWYKTNVLGE